jgi:hypothetical protein
MRSANIALLLLLIASSAHADLRITIDRNVEEAAKPGFQFKGVPSPAKDDAAAHAELALIAGRPDGNSAGLNALTDGLLPGEDDQPGANFFFRAGSWGGRIRMDLGRAIDIAQIHSYSWHSDSRAPQVYKVYGSDGSDPTFDAMPPSKLDPITRGWKLIAFVDSRPKEGDEGGQYGVSIADSSGTLGRYRYLLFDCFEAESEDAWGNTFYSEIDVCGAGDLACATQSPLTTSIPAASNALEAIGLEHSPRPVTRQLDKVAAPQVIEAEGAPTTIGANHGHVEEPSGALIAEQQSAAPEIDALHDAADVTGRIVPATVIVRVDVVVAARKINDVDVDHSAAEDAADAHRQAGAEIASAIAQAALRDPV